MIYKRLSVLVPLLLVAAAAAQEEADLGEPVSSRIVRKVLENGTIVEYEYIYYYDYEDGADTNSVDFEDNFATDDPVVTTELPTTTTTKATTTTTTPEPTTTTPAPTRRPPLLEILNNEVTERAEIGLRSRSRLRPGGLRPRGRPSLSRDPIEVPVGPQLAAVVAEDEATPQAPGGVGRFFGSRSRGQIIRPQSVQSIEEKGVDSEEAASAAVEQQDTTQLVEEQTEEQAIGRGRGRLPSRAPPSLERRRRPGPSLTRPSRRRPSVSQENEVTTTEETASQLAEENAVEDTSEIVTERPSRGRGSSRFRGRSRASSSSSSSSGSSATSSRGGRFRGRSRGTSQTAETSATATGAVSEVTSSGTRGGRFLGRRRGQGRGRTQQSVTDTPVDVAEERLPARTRFPPRLTTEAPEAELPETTTEQLEEPTTVGTLGERNLYALSRGVEDDATTEALDEVDADQLLSIGDVAESAETESDTFDLDITTPETTTDADFFRFDVRDESDTTEIDFSALRPRPTAIIELTPEPPLPTEEVATEPAPTTTTTTTEQPEQERSPRLSLGGRRRRPPSFLGRRGRRPPTVGDETLAEEPTARPGRGRRPSRPEPVQTQEETEVPTSPRRRLPGRLSAGRRRLPARLGGRRGPSVQDTAEATEPTEASAEVETSTPAADAPEEAVAQVSTTSRRLSPGGRRRLPPGLRRLGNPLRPSAPEPEAIESAENEVEEQPPEPEIEEPVAAEEVPAPTEEPLEPSTEAPSRGRLGFRGRRPRLPARLPGRRRGRPQPQPAEEPEEAQEQTAEEASESEPATSTRRGSRFRPKATFRERPRSSILLGRAGRRPPLKGRVTEENPAAPTDAPTDEADVTAVIADEEPIPSDSVTPEAEEQEATSEATTEEPADAAPEEPAEEENRVEEEPEPPRRGLLGRRGRRPPLRSRSRSRPSRPTGRQAGADAIVTEETSSEAEDEQSNTVEDTVSSGRRRGSFRPRFSRGQAEASTRTNSFKRPVLPRRSSSRRAPQQEPEEDTAATDENSTVDKTEERSEPETPVRARRPFGGGRRRPLFRPSGRREGITTATPESQSEEKPSEPAEAAETSDAGATVPGSRQLRFRTRGRGPARDRSSPPAAVGRSIFGRQGGGRRRRPLFDRTAAVAAPAPSAEEPVQEVEVKTVAVEEPAEEPAAEEKPAEPVKETEPETPAEDDESAPEKPSGIFRRPFSGGRRPPSGERRAFIPGVRRGGRRERPDRRRLTALLGNPSAEAEETTTTTSTTEAPAPVQEEEQPIDAEEEEAPGDATAVEQLLVVQGEKVETEEELVEGSGLEPTDEAEPEVTEEDEVPVDVPTTAAPEPEQEPEEAITTTTERPARATRPGRGRGGRAGRPSLFEQLRQRSG